MDSLIHITYLRRAQGVRHNNVRTTRIKHHFTCECHRILLLFMVLLIMILEMIMIYYFIM